MRGMQRRPVLSATLMLLALAGCDQTASPRPDDTAERMSLRPETVARRGAELVVPAAEWRAGTAGSEARLALIVAADSYLEPSWTIGAARNNLAAVRQGLEGACGITGEGVVELSGERVNRDAIRAALARLGRLASGRPGVLFIYWTGHGFVDAQGEPRWFTHYTRELAAGGFDNVISRGELAGWIGEACGGTITPVVVADVCRPRLNAPPPAATLAPLALWELQATRAGRYSEAPPPERASPFTRAFVDSLASLAQAGGGGFENVAAETTRRCLELTGGRQEPELIRPAASLADPGLIRGQRVALAVEVVDAVGGQLITGATLRLDARPPQEPGSGPQRIETAPGRHLLRLSAPGYCARVEEIDVTAARAGAVLRLALPPSLVRIAGRLSPAGIYGVRVRGLDLPLRPGFHQLQVTSAADGSFELQLPGVAEGAEVVVTQGDAIVGRAAIPGSPDRCEPLMLQGIEGVRAADLGIIAIRGGSGDAVLRAQQSAGPGVIGMPPEVLRPPTAMPAELSDALDRNRWEQMQRMVQLKRYDIAADQLAGIAGKLPEATLGRWQAFIRMHQAEAAASPEDVCRQVEEAGGGLEQRVLALVAAQRLLKEPPTPARIEALTGLELHLAEAPEGAAVRTLRLAAAARLLDDRSIAPAERLAWMLALSGPQWEDAGWQAARRQAWEGAMLALVAEVRRQGLESGDWSRFAQLPLFRALLPEGHGCQSVRQAIEELEKEVQPSAARRELEAARAAMALGDDTGTLLHYAEAVRLGASAHVRAEAERHTSYIRQQLFIRNYNTGLEHETEGRLGLALVSYIAARDYGPSVARDVERLEAAGLDVAQYEQVWGERDGLDDQLQNALEQQDGAELTAILDVYPQHPEAQRLSELAILWPSWASATGRDEHGAWADLVVGDFRQRFRFIPPGYAVHGCGPLEAVRQSRLANALGASHGEDAYLRDPDYVLVAKGFWLADSECTQANWQVIMGTMPARHKDARHPMESVTWDECMAFVAALSRRADAAVTLPTSAQWEHACRAGTAAPWWNGADPEQVARIGNVRDAACMRVYDASKEPAIAADDGFGGVAPVKSFPPNPFGLHDMIGNVKEWCLDGALEYPSGSEAAELQQLRKLVAEKPDDSDILNSLAWRLLVACDATLRRPQEALALATRAAELTSRKQTEILDTLAVAYGELGQWDLAIAAEQEALAMLSPGTKSHKLYTRVLAKLQRKESVVGVSLCRRDPRGALSDPLGMHESGERVVRGGSFYAHPVHGTASFISRQEPVQKGDLIGFRLAIAADAPEAGKP